MWRKALVLLAWLPLILHAETITGNCSIMDQPNGKEQFTLAAGTTVACSQPQKGWCMILFKGYIDKKWVYDGIRILDHARIRDAKGKHIGRVTHAFNPYRTISENDTCFIMEIAGYIEVVCIEDTSIVEHEIEKLYKGSDSLLSITQFNKHMREFGYKQWVGSGTFYSFLLMETDLATTKPGLRVAIIFDRDKAIAILHRRKLQVQSFESAMHGPRYGLIYLGRFSESYKKQVADLYLHEAESLYE